MDRIGKLEVKKKREKEFLTYHDNCLPFSSFMR
jgi:Fe-S oxidoreductase